MTDAVPVKFVMAVSRPKSKIDYALLNNREVRLGVIILRWEMTPRSLLYGCHYSSLYRPRGDLIAIKSRDMDISKSSCKWFKFLVETMSPNNRQHLCNYARAIVALPRSLRLLNLLPRIDLVIRGLIIKLCCYYLCISDSNRWLFDGTCFSTYDRDSNNGIGKECARDTATGWWFFGYRHNANHTEYCKTDLNPNFYRRYHKSRMLIKLIT